MTKVNHLHLVSHEVPWERWKALHEKVCKDSGPVPLNMDKELWEMVRNKQIYAYFCDEMGDDMRLGFKVPEHDKLTVLS